MKIKSRKAERQSGTQADRSSGHMILHIPRTWATLVAVLLLAPWLFVAYPRIKANLIPKIQTRASNGWSGPTSRHIPSKPGPWGDLQVTRIVTEPPEEFVGIYLQNEPPKWVLADYTPDKLRELFRAAALNDADTKELHAKTVWDASGNGCVILPGDDFVLGMSSQTRATIYMALARSPQNRFQNEPFRFQADSIDEWFEDSELSGRTVAMVKRLIYQRGKTALFSDVGPVLSTLTSSEDKLRLLKTLSRQSTLLAVLKITPDTDTSALVAYWGGKEGTAKDIKPMLESLAKAPGGSTFDITHLLPRFARMRLYTYASLSKSVNEPAYDCHWTSMNFWNSPPDDRFASLDYVRQVIESEYYPVFGEYVFGDVLLFMISDAEAIHSAVYIADDIVFTKNGPTIRSPWILMKMDVLVAYYETGADLKIRGFRRKR